jgi:hypothetical protein
MNEPPPVPPKNSNTLLIIGGGFFALVILMLVLFVLSGRKGGGGGGGGGGGVPASPPSISTPTVTNASKNAVTITAEVISIPNTTPYEVIFTKKLPVSPVNQRIISFSGDNINDFETGKVISGINPPLEMGVWYVMIDVTSMSVESSLSEFSVELTHQLINTINVPNTTVSYGGGVSLSGTGDIVSYNFSESVIYLYESNGSHINLNTYVPSIRRVSISHIGHRIAVLDNNSIVSFFDKDATTNTYQKTLISTVSVIADIVDISLSKDYGTKLGILRGNGDVMICHRDAGYYYGNYNTIDTITTGITSPVRRISLNEDGTKLAISDDHHVKLYIKNNTSGLFELIHTFNYGDSVVYSISLTNTYLSVLISLAVDIFDITSTLYEKVKTIHVDSSRIMDLLDISMSADNTHIAIAGGENDSSTSITVQLYELTA